MRARARIQLLKFFVFFFATADFTRSCVKFSAQEGEQLREAHKGDLAHAFPIPPVIPCAAEEDACGRCSCPGCAGGNEGCCCAVLGVWGGQKPGQPLRLMNYSNTEFLLISRLRGKRRLSQHWMRFIWLQLASTRPPSPPPPTAVVPSINVTHISKWGKDPRLYCERLWRRVATELWVINVVSMQNLRF